MKEMVRNRTFRSMRKTPELMALDTIVGAGHLSWPIYALLSRLNNHL